MGSNTQVSGLVMGAVATAVGFIMFLIVNAVRETINTTGFEEAGGLQAIIPLLLDATLVGFVLLIFAGLVVAVVDLFQRVRRR